MPIHKKIAICIAACAALAIIAFGLNQMRELRIAHSTFETYYAFRGCSELISRTADSGICKTAGGQTIKIVQFQNKWYLDGDLPSCWNNFCF